MLTIDLTNAPDPNDERYSANVLGNARRAVKLQRVTQLVGVRDTFYVTSLRRNSEGISPRYLVILQRDERGDVLGGTCTCPNGRNLARAICYHVAAVELWLEKQK